MTVLEITYLIINIVVALAVMAEHCFFMAYSKNSKIDWEELEYCFKHDYMIGACMIVTIIVTSHFLTKGILG